MKRGGNKSAGGFSHLCMKMHLVKSFFVSALAVASFLTIGGALSANAVTNNVAVGQGGLVFVPATNNINVNDTIIWTWAGPNHSTTSDATGTGAWDSGVNNSPFSYTNSFPTAGIFPFRCTVHAAEGMAGSVNVSAVVNNSPPTVTITNPVAGTVLSAPANVTIRANAQDSDGTVASVQFFVDNVSVGTTVTAPYSAVASGLAAGTHTLTAIATDNLNATGTNSVTISVVTPVTASPSLPVISHGTNFSFTYSVNTGLDYLIQRTTNIAATTWVPLQTNQATVNPATFVDSNTPASGAFYRVGRMPNP